MDSELIIQVMNKYNQVEGFSGSSDGKESSCNAKDPGLIPGSGRAPGEGNGNPLQYSCLTNPMDRGACPFGRLQSIGLQRVRQTKHKHTLTQNLY